jgi:hypothetical protein
MHTSRMHALPLLATSLQRRSAGMASSHFVATKIPRPARGRLGFFVPQEHCLPCRLSDIASPTSHHRHRLTDIASPTSPHRHRLSTSARAMLATA